MNGRHAFGTAAILLLGLTALVYTLHEEGVPGGRILWILLMVAGAVVTMFATVGALAACMLSSRISRGEEAAELRRICPPDNPYPFSAGRDDGPDPAA